MSLSTIIRASVARPAPAGTALVLMGGGARTAYQVGVLRAFASMLELQAGQRAPFPFAILVGTSAGALNVSYLASQAGEGLQAFSRLAQFWSRLRSDDVYWLDVPAWARHSRLAAAFCLWRNARRWGAILDNMPLVDTLHRGISLLGIEQSLQSRAIDALAVTASSYTSGVHWTFVHTRPDHEAPGWTRPGRRSEAQPITIEHLMASSAIPFLFRSTPLWVSGRREYFGDGSMRQVSPLSPAIQLGAHRILVVGVGQPERACFSGAHAGSGPPTMSGIGGHAMASVFHDTLRADVEQAQRVNGTMRQMAPEVARALPYRSVEVLAIQPSQSLDALALSHVHALPASIRRALGGLGLMKGGGGALASYLLFEPAFVQSLIALGERDAYARKEELLPFLMAQTA